jgi:DNA-binding transcriptional MerR regulator
MKKKMFFKDELLTEAGIDEEMLGKWQKVKLIKPDGVTSDNMPFYLRRNLERILHIKRLLDLGYQLEDIQKIIKKVGLPGTGSKEGKSAKTSEFLTVGGLAERVGVSSRAIKHWEEKGIIEPDMRSEGGFRLYSESYVYLCQLIKDLQLFGYSLEEIKDMSSLFRDFLAMENDLNSSDVEIDSHRLDEMRRKIHVLEEKINHFKAGIERWEDLLKKKKKEISALKSQNKKRLKPKGKKKNA